MRPNRWWLELGLILIPLLLAAFAIPAALVLFAVTRKESNGEIIKDGLFYGLVTAAGIFTLFVLWNMS